MKNFNAGILILRLSIGLLMLLHGIHKLINGVEGVKNILADKGIPEIFAYGVYLGEFVAPLLIILGFRTRIAALLLISNMLVIIFIAHPEQIFMLTKSGGWKLELQGLFLFGALALFFTGGGAYAVSSKSRWD